MERSKNQAVYKFLPEMWISVRLNSGEAVTAKLERWNPIRMTGIYENFIESEIKRQIKLFGARNGDIGSFCVEDGVSSFRIVEPACNDGIPDITGQISPLVFYCSSCGAAFEERSAASVNKYTWKCNKCGKRSVKQLQMVYACECGFAQPITLPFRGRYEMFYHPNVSPYKMTYKKDGKTQIAEFEMHCPTCNKKLRPDNANSGRNYKPFPLRVINLVDDRAGKFYEKGIEAQKTVVAKWFGELDQAKFEKVLDNIELAFSKDFRSDAKRAEAEAQVRGLMAIGLITQDGFETAVQSLLGNSNQSEYGIEKYIAFYDSVIGPQKDEAWLNNYSFKLMQYDTIKYAKRTITLEESVQRQIDLEFIDDAEEVHALNRKMGIKNMQVSYDIEIINCTYGYTRRVSDPCQSSNKNCRLKLNAYEKTRDGTQNLVYSSKLETEGILFEIDQRKIIEWLFHNNVIDITQVPDLDDDIAIKKWFAENVRSEKISMFGEIDPQEIITRHVFSLLHTMSHAFIKTAGEISGLAGNSLAEIIIIETASIFIYAQTSQGIPLGALSGMAENSYKNFLQKTFEDNLHCIFDPICSERDQTSCSACVQIPEISCNHFNAGLGRKYLYTIEETANPITGFWEM